MYRTHYEFSFDNNDLTVLEIEYLSVNKHYAKQ